MKKLLLFFSLLVINSLSGQSDLALRINAGGTETEYNGETFVADNFFDKGRTLDRPQTGLPEPYKTFRFSTSKQMGYTIPVTNGEYTVNLHFAELWFGATGGGQGGVGKRVFDVIIEGQLADDNLDVYEEVGAEAMLVKTHTLTITDGELNIDFSSLDVDGGERHPIVNAIEILGGNTQEIKVEGLTYYRSGGSAPDPIGSLNDGDKIYKSIDAGYEFEGVVAEVSNAVKSFLYEFSGAGGIHTFEGEEGVIFGGVGDEIGVHTLKVTPYSEENLGGVQGDPLSITYEILNHCDAIAIETFDASSCSATDGYAILRDQANNQSGFSSDLDDMWVYDEGIGAFKASNLAPDTYQVSFENYDCTVTRSFVIEGTDCPNSDFELRINAGGSEIVYNGETFVADNFADTGSVLDRPQTGLPEPFQTFRFSPSQEMSYNIPLQDGAYTLNLYFAELWFGATDGGAGGVGNRVFDVNIEGLLAEDNLDIFSEVGADAMLVKTHTATVTDGVLDIDFDSRDVVGGERHPVINGIEILAAAPPQNPMIVTWQTDASHPLGVDQGLGVDIGAVHDPNVNGSYTVDWGNNTAVTTNTSSHTYSVDGTYTITISGDIHGVKFGSSSGSRTGTEPKLISIEQWGDMVWTTAKDAFVWCGNLDVTATDVPNLSQVTDMSSMFEECESLVGNSSFNDWDVSGVVDMGFTFRDAEMFNAPIGNWDVGNVISMEGTFLDATVFDQDISNWDFSSVQEAILPTLQIVKFSTANYDDLLLSLDAQALNSGIRFDMGDSEYCLGATARQQITNASSWTFTDAGLDVGCQGPNDFALRINAGGPETTYNGEIFLTDDFYDTGRTLSRPQTGLEEPYRTFRFSPSQAMAYNIPVPRNGDYTVVLHFAELWFGATGGGSGGFGNRVFDVNMEGLLAEDNLDVYLEAGGPETMITKNYIVNVTDGELNIDFDSSDAVGGERHPIINAIEVLGVDSQVAKDEFWLEAECATIEGDLPIVDDLAVSGGKYVIAPLIGNGNTENNRITLDVTVSESGIYSIYALLNNSSEENTIYFRTINQLPQDFRFTERNVSDEFKWYEIVDVNTVSSTLRFYLEKGVNQIPFWDFSPGVGIDAFFITKSNTKPVGKGRDDNNCNSNFGTKTVRPNLSMLIPNPVIESTTIRFEKPVELATIHIFDITGRLVHTSNGPEVANDGVYTINVNDLGPGTYFIKSIDVNGIKHQKQMVIKK